ncbi:unnamed protein product [Mytilus coruscus]|uniref:Uncharacterized protein n=1 Tax=Mytilus coruscus TaxID=42192 RepID=A0A6J8B7V0_MYTCO|nr:unnamed protein product [Mytilus coruscus]
MEEELVCPSHLQQSCGKDCLPQLLWTATTSFHGTGSSLFQLQSTDNTGEKRESSHNKDTKIKRVTELPDSFTAFFTKINPIPSKVDPKESPCQLSCLYNNVKFIFTNLQGYRQTGHGIDIHVAYPCATMSSIGSWNRHSIFLYYNVINRDLQ